MNEYTSNDEDVEQYKHMLEQANAYEESVRSDELLGMQDDPPKSPYGRNRMGNSSGHSHGHKWGPPVSPEQFRPDAWLVGGGKSPLSAKRSYHAKSPAGGGATGKAGNKKSSSFRGLPSIDLDSTAHSTNTMATFASARTATTAGHEPKSPSRRSGKGSSHGSTHGSRHGSRHGSSHQATRSPIPGSSPRAVQPRSPHGGGSNHTTTTTTTTPSPPYSQATADLSPRGRVGRSDKKVPPLAPSVSMLQEASGSKIFSDEVINANKFVAAFAAFEAVPPPPSVAAAPTTPKQQRRWGAAASPLSAGMSPQRSTHHLLSPSGTAPRNYTVSPSALRGSGGRAAAASSQPPTPELDDLAAIISRLRRVTVNPRRGAVAGDKSDYQASYLLEIVRQLRKVDRSTTVPTRDFSDILSDLRRTGVLASATLRPEDVADLRQVLARLRAVQARYPDRHDFPHADLETVVRDVEDVLAPETSGRAASGGGRNLQETLEDAIGRLKAVSPRLSNPRDKAETEQVTLALAKIVDRLKERDERELASVIRGLDAHGADGENEGLRELRRMLATLEDIDNADGGGPFARSNLSSEDAEFLASCIQRLQKANMTPKEAESVAGVVVQLRTVEVEDAEAESESDELIASLEDTVYPKQKSNVVTRILKSLRRIDMNDRERTDIAEVIARMGDKEGSFTDELAEVISKLRKAKLNKYEARQVSGILINLRRTRYPDHGKVAPQWEMVTLRKVTTPEKMKAIEEAVGKIKAVQGSMDDKAFDSFVDEVATLGRGPPTEQQDCHNELADAISRLKKVQMNPREAKAVSGLLFSLRKTRYPERGEPDDAKEFDRQLRSVVAPPERKAEIEDAVRQIKRVRWNLDCEVFEFFVDEMVASAGGGDEGPSKDGGKKSPAARSPGRDKKPSPKPSPPAKPSPVTAASPVDDEQRKIVFNRMHHWKHNQFHGTVIGEKRWRLSEGFANDAVIFSPLSQEQYDRRKAVGESLAASMGDLGVPLGDESHVDEVERKLQENDLTLGIMERHASSSKRAALVQKSPKRATGSPVKMAGSPGCLPL